MYREVVRKYAAELDSLVKEAKKKMSGEERDLVGDMLLELAEEVFFSSKEGLGIDVRHVRAVIRGIYLRISSRYGVIKELLDDPDVNEIMVNGPDSIFIERKGELLLYDDAFTCEDELEELIRMFASDVHREINESNPIVDARLESGYRVNGVLRNVALNGPILTIRKFSNDEISMADMINFGSISEECAAMLKEMVRAGYNIFISGGTSSGKTTFLNALAQSIDKEERVIIIEDSAELRVDHFNNYVQMECRNANSIGKGEVSMENLIRTSLRMRPDRIIVGEVRGREVIDMIQAMSTGHDGSMSTGHGNSIKGMLSRLETMYLSDQLVPTYSVKSQISNAIDIIVHLKRGSDGSRRVVEVAEIVGFDGNDYELNYLFETKDGTELVRTGNEIVKDEKLRRYENVGRLRKI